jgi:uncharacterized protein (TIGR00255 family)
MIGDTMAGRPNSMTGYARAEGRDAAKGVAWVWDLRSVNGKGLDLRCRLPGGYEPLEKPLRDRLSAAFSRGSISVSLSLVRDAAAIGLRLNQAWLDVLIDAAAETIFRHPGAVLPPAFDGLLQVKGVVESADLPDPASAAEEEALAAALLADFDRAVAALAQSRAEEGERIAAVVAAQVDEIETLVGRAQDCAAARPEAQKAKLHRLVAELLETAEMPEDRLAQELALIVTRIDVREELDRLGSHIVAARTLLAQGVGIGRKFDFLCQEFNREANTLCSKSSDAELTSVGLALKTVIDRLREQIQNIE